MATSEIVDADNKKPIGVDGFIWADHVVPPARVLVLLAVITGDMMRAGKRMADQDCIAFVGVELAVGFVHQFVVRQACTATQCNGLIKARGLRRNNTDRCEIRRMHGWFVKNLFGLHYIAIVLKLAAYSAAKLPNSR